MRIDKFEGEFEFLSNFYNSPITWMGVEYPTVEHFFQAMKTFDLDEREAIAATPTPGKAKRMGRSVQLREDWEEAKDTYMQVGLMLKFAHPDLKKKLLATGDAELVEGNTWHDNIWGDCRCDKCSGRKGENRLGRLLMKIRKELGDA